MVAQLVEHSTPDHELKGSNPAVTQYKEKMIEKNVRRVMSLGTQCLEPIV